ncbi:MAG: peptide/nickel transport system ATP-binding protein [Acidimicrobiaceae bacterium]|nr:peptide/nickel transport system ATP-binding protein [Acidimicrobiaceae bacterium]MDQ1419494.1 peptide/nickel transport system ATP-binding protein [Acidimicrobiaceae bacterium]MDQ1441103.1 peptide/nickel transport system ATP-binding protein [Acidimicrobiaceae bacterium]
MAQDLKAENPQDVGLPPLDPIRAGEPLLSVRDLKVRFKTDDGILKAVDGVSYDVYPNEVVGIVGESGSGKSVSSLAIMGLLPKSAEVTGEIVFRGQDLLHMDEKDRRKLRGGRLAMVFQDALAALNPVFTVGDQIAEAIAAHQPKMGKQAKRKLTMDLLDLVGIPNPSARVDQYPHEFSGGMRQRAMIAMSIANEPDVLIADEPTTALDVTIQAQVLEVLERIQDRTNSAIVLITHDLGVVAGVADRVVVMYAGRPVETSVVDEIFYHPRHPYTIGLMASLPRLDAAGARTERLYRIKGQPPSLIFLPSGCPFHPRCEFAELPAPCSTIRPDLELVDHTYGRHMAACHRRHDMADVNPDELHADAGAELEAVEDAAVITPAEAKAMEQLSVPTEEQE